MLIADILYQKSLKRLSQGLGSIDNEGFYCKTEHAQVAGIGVSNFRAITEGRADL